MTETNVDFIESRVKLPNVVVCSRDSYPTEVRYFNASKLDILIPASKIF